MSDSFYKDFIFNNVSEGVISVDAQGTVLDINKKAKMFFGLDNENAVHHEAGVIEKGDIVIIGDNSIGLDDGGLTCEDLKHIGIVCCFPEQTAFLAVGKYGIENSGIIEHVKEWDKETLIKLDVNIDKHSISAYIDFVNKIINISVNGKTFVYKYVMAIGHAVIISAKTGEVKFYQSSGYTSRHEDLKLVLTGKPFLEKTNKKRNINYEGVNIFDIYPKSLNNDIIYLVDAANDKTEEYYDKIRLINGLPTKCTLYKNRENDKVIGATLFIQDVSELNYVVNEKNYLINKITHREKFEKKIGALAGASLSMQKVKHLLLKASNSISTILILGESGTGKSMYARLIHETGIRQNKPFVQVNCASLPTSLIESELFGYGKGAFTGADPKGKRGLIEEAQGGTLFLDEIGDLPMDVQAKLLHVLQSKVITKIGQTKEQSIDVRIIAATNKNLDDMVKNGRFREDLYYRLNIFPIHIPPLRKRKEDIIPLSYKIIPMLCEKLNVSQKGVAMNVMNILLAYDWPGNIRELENVLERAIVLSDTDMITVEDIFINEDITEEGFKVAILSLQTAVENAEKQAITTVLKMCDNNKSDAMKLLGVGRTTFYDKMKKYGIK